MSSSKPRLFTRPGQSILLRLTPSYALALPSHVPFHAAKGYPLSVAKQVLSGRMDSLIKTIEHNAALLQLPELATGAFRSLCDHCAVRIEPNKKRSESILAIV